MDIMDSQWMCQKIFGLNHSKPMVEPIKQTLCQLCRRLNRGFCHLNLWEFGVAKPEIGRVCRKMDANFAAWAF
jgi:hypothetical protein